jgi:hypothetical protein
MKRSRRALPRLPFLCLVCCVFMLCSANSVDAQQTVTASSTAIDFGDVPINSSNSEIVTLTCGGTDQSVSLAVSGSGFDLSLAPGQPTRFTLKGGTTGSFAVVFSPKTTATFTGGITITATPTAGSSPTPTIINISLRGEVTEGNLAVDPANISFPNSPCTLGKKSGVKNKKAKICTSLSGGAAISNLQTVAVTNRGGTTVKVNVTPPGTGFAMQSSPSKLNPGETQSVVMEFEPHTQGLTTGVLTITNDGNSKNTFRIPITAAAYDVKSLPECSLSKTNKNCKLVIDRANPVAPSTIQMYSRQRLFIVVEHPKRFERYFLDPQSSQATLSPDVTSSILQSIFPDMAKMGGFFALEGAAPAAPDFCKSPDVTLDPPPGRLKDKLKSFQDCFAQLATDAIAIYHQLEPGVTPDSLTTSVAPSDINTDSITESITAFVASETIVSSRIASISSNPNYKTNGSDMGAVQLLSDLQKMADGVASDLLNFKQRLSDLDQFKNEGYPCSAFVENLTSPSAHCVYIVSNRDDDRIYENMVTRTVTYSLDTLNLISNSQQAAIDPTKKKALMSIAVNFADYPLIDSAPTENGTDPKLHVWSALRWEASAGVFFSTIPDRTFSVRPIYTSPTAPPTVMDNKIKESAPLPTPLPFVAANYRLTDDNLFGRWKSNIYWTAAIGINPNSTVAEYATGFSYSWRALMLSALCHFGHDVHLNQGFTPETDLGKSFNGNTLPTNTYWTGGFAFGISVRVPSLTGR